MPWRESQEVPFTRIDIVSAIPADPGVYAVMEGENCLLVGETWNLKGKLLELANAINGSEGLTLVFELCDEDSSRVLRRQELTRELIPDLEPPLDSHDELVPKRLPGISFSDGIRRLNGKTG
jgi:hypothetical protein